MEIDCAWAENYFVTKANLLHKHVHKEKVQYFANNKRTYTSVSVFNDKKEYNLYGVTDCLEVSGTNKDKFCIVEYKPKKPKNKDYNFDDLMQVFAQKVCVDYTFNSDCDGIIYYADVKKRIKLPLKENFDEYNQLLMETLVEMRTLLSAGKIPPIQKNQKCSGCSMKDMCMPKIKTAKNIRTKIKKLLEET